MKNTIYLFGFYLMMLLVASCEKDDMTVSDQLERDIVGTWNWVGQTFDGVDEFIHDDPCIPQSSLVFAENKTYQFKYYASDLQGQCMTIEETAGTYEFPYTDDTIVLYPGGKDPDSSTHQAEIEKLRIDDDKLVIYHAHYVDGDGNPITRDLIFERQ